LRLRAISFHICGFFLFLNLIEPHLKHIPSWQHIVSLRASICAVRFCRVSAFFCAIRALGALCSLSLAMVSQYENVRDDSMKISVGTYF
jgi:hypothetical protein